MRTNEELAAAARTGGLEQQLVLWEQVRRYAWRQARHWMLALDGRGGVTEEDLVQSGFLALLDALETFDPTNGGSFLSWFGFYLKTAFQDAMGLRTERRRQEPINSAVSIDIPLTDEPDGLTLSDTIRDPQAEAAFTDVAERDRLERLHRALQAALELLTEEQRAAVVGRYCRGQKVDRRACEAGLRALRAPEVSKMLRQFCESA